MYWADLRHFFGVHVYLFLLRYHMIKKLLVFTGWLLTICMVLAFCVAGALWLEWSTLTTLFVWISILVTGVLLWGFATWLNTFFRENTLKSFLRKFRLSRQEYVLYKLWRKGVSVIKSIQRKRTSIPWYIFMGERCGKSSLLAGSGLPMFTNSSDDYLVTPTHTLRWWFFRNVCILDLSSNFLCGTSSIQRSWDKLVGWISRGPAPAGIIVGIDIDDLLNDEGGILHDKARRIRSQIEPLTRRLKRQLPVYILITQCDKMDGFKVWSKKLSISQIQQVLGHYWQESPDIDGKDDSTLYPLFENLKTGLDFARFSMSDTSMSSSERAILLDFPESFSRIKKSLTLFLASLCEPNVYFSAISLGGVWFTASEVQDSNKSRRTSYFINDLLTQHLSVFSQSRDVVWYHNTKLRYFFISVFLLGAMTLLGISAVSSAKLMKGRIHSLSQSELTNLLVKNESHQDSPLFYLPFIPVLDYQHNRIESSIVLKIRPRPRDFSYVIEEYKNQVINANPGNQRMMILNLAQAIITYEQMLDGTKLENLNQLPAIPDELHISVTESFTTSLERLVADRWMLRQPSGAGYIKSLRSLLASLINYDPSLMWLTAPIQYLPDINSSDYWHDLPGTVILSGIWTRQGEEQINVWVDLLNLALEGTQNESVLKTFLQNLPVKRQDAWRGFLLGVMPLLQDTKPHSLSTDQLISIGEGQSSAMKFSHRINDELDNINPSMAQSWLNELRQLQKLPSYTSEPVMFQKARQADIQLRSKLTAWLFKGKLPVPENSVAQQIDAWKVWRLSLNNVVVQAISQATLSPSLTQGLFVPATKSATGNPQIALFTNFDKLRKSLHSYSQEPGIDAVWSLYRNDADLLLAHSMARSACWLNEQWKSKVLWPMSKDASAQDYDSRQALSWQYISDFIRNSTKGLLIVSEQGPKSGEFQGQTLPLNADFLRVARYMLNPEDILDAPEHTNTLTGDKLAIIEDQITTLTKQLNTLTEKIFQVTIISGPATIPEKARLVPIGSSLTLVCQNGSQIIDSMNFAEHAQFNWQPGLCQGVKLDVKFPGFTATYRYTGNSAWPDFISDLVSGEALLDTNNFDDGIDLLEELGIKHVLVRFKIMNQQPLQEAWSEWNSLDEKIMVLIQQQQSLKEQLEIQQPSAALRGRFSELPKNVAECN